MSIRVPETPIVHADFTITAPFRVWANSRGSAPIIGTGSPEGVVEAPQFSEYINKAGSTGSIKWIKMQTAISGDRSQGWVLL